MAAHLAARGDDRSRAYAALLASVYDPDAERRFAELLERCKSKPGQPCNLHDMAPGDESRRVVARETLARLAVTTSDPEVYARAWQACLPITERRPRAEASGGAGSQCTQLSLQRWAALDAGNAVPWLHVLAQPGLTPAQMAEVLHQIAQSQRVEHSWGRLPAAVVEAEGSGVPRGWLMNAALAALGIDAQMTPPYSSLKKQCDTAAVTDANRRQTCEAIADLLGFRSNALLDQSIGQAIGRKIGWPADKQRQLDDERDAMLAVSISPQIDGQPLSCASYDRMRRYWSTAAKDGELGLVRAALAASGEPLGVLAERGRREQREFSERIRAAAAPASAASAAR
ncbi:hypothetical protein [Rivibacter subsaxonicus]|uniref:Uncharacterized protein n=1 Tax=Rivibacter subsaxonicus TaxID=457575 RepID=A0A4Q7VG00_9BURK|nr:hypothetical protein [Rivibacter subsaxonicus]RZT94929.1 hypothetical protein EV670_2675 [Rivibacter subsaxonicus]